MNNIITQEEKNTIDALCYKYNIENYTINSDGSNNVIIDVIGDVEIILNSNLTRPGNFIYKLPLQFGKVTGSFSIEGNARTLEGCPKIVGGHFNCSYNQLTSLYGCPSEVDGDFSCGGNSMKSLEHCPVTVGGNFEANGGCLTSLEFSPVTIGGHFDCCHNNISSLESCPIDVTMGYSLGYGNNFPEQIEEMLLEEGDEAEEKLRIFIKYQSYYDVWTPGFNTEGFNELIAEIKDGLK